MKDLFETGEPEPIEVVLFMKTRPDAFTANRVVEQYRENIRANMTHEESIDMVMIKHSISPDQINFWFSVDQEPEPPSS